MSDFELGYLTGVDKAREAADTVSFYFIWIFLSVTCAVGLFTEDMNIVIGLVFIMAIIENILIIKRIDKVKR